MASQKAKQIDFLLAGVRDSSGDPYKAGKVYFWESSAKTTAKTVWRDRNKAVAWTQPVILGNSGEATVFGDGEYYIEVYDKNSVLIKTHDLLSYTAFVDFGGLYIDVGALYGTSTQALEAAIADTNAAQNYTFLFKDAEFAASTDMTFTDNIIIKAAITATIRQTSGTITIDRTPEIPDFQFFTNTPSVTWGSKVQEVKPIWTGGDATTEAADFKGKVNMTGLKLNGTDITPTAAELNSSVVPGTICAFATSSAPEGWLVCNAQNVSRTTYNRLFLAIGSGTIWGDGNGTTTFTLPDMRARYMRGENISHSVGQYLDQLTKMPTSSFTGSTDTTGSHSHSFSSSWPHHIDHGYDHIVSVHDHVVGVGSGAISSAGSHSHTTTITSGGDSETRPNTSVVLYCIKF